jgi:hypothetical protein
MRRVCLRRHGFAGRPASFLTAQPTENADRPLIRAHVVAKKSLHRYIAIGSSKKTIDRPAKGRIIIN